MKNLPYLIILLALGFVIITYRWVASDKPENVIMEKENLAIEDIMTRSSVRKYSDKPVTEQQIDTLLRAAMAAPTAGNKQPWRFVVIQDKETLDYIADNFETMTMTRNAQLAIVACGDTEATYSGEGLGYWIQDVSAASENLLLAAHAMGLGAVWCGVYPISDRVKKFSELLNLPSNILPLNCIAIGYPAGESTPKDKWKPEYVHYEKWDSKD